jgi:alpha-tubulin suppressor-like RCC1 family protein
MPITVPGLNDVVQISVGDVHTCALLGDRTVTCWGKNGYGELGLGFADPFDMSQRAETELDNHPPTQVLDSVRELVVGGGTNWVWRQDNTLEGWGANEYGQLGMIGPVSVNQPTPLPVLDGMVTITGHTAGGCGVRGGAVECWGYDIDGTSKAPRAMGPSDVISLSGALNYGCARLSGDNVVCWGKNDYGQLGNGTRMDSTTPVSLKW